MPTGTPPPIASGSTYIIKANTVIDTSRTSPSITTDAVTDAGAFFRDVATNGSPSGFLFASTTLFDNQLNFDARFAADYANTGVFRFTALELEGNPSFITRSGANKIALISATNITSSTLGGTVNLRGLDSLFLGTGNGSITLSDRFTFTKADGDAFKTLTLYARGGDVNFGASMNLKDASLAITAERDINVQSPASIRAENALFTSQRNVVIDGAVTAKFAQVYAGGELRVNGAISADTIYGFGQSATISGTFSGKNVSFQTGGNLTLTSAGALNASDKLNVTTGGALTLQGSTNVLEDATSSSRVFTLNAGTDLNLSGILNTSYRLVATGQNAFLTNRVTGKDITFTLSNGFQMSGPAVINSENLTISSAGVLSLGVVNNSDKLVLTSGTNAQLVDGSLNFNGAVATKELTATGSTVNVSKAVTGEKLTFTSRGNFVSQVGGDLTANNGSENHVTINAGDSITLSGNTTAKNVYLTAGTTNNLPGALTINGAVRADSKFVATSKRATLNAILNGKDATFNAGTIFHLTGSGAMNLTGDAAITASSVLTLDGNVTTVGNLSLNGLANITGHGSITANDMTVAGSNVTFTGPIRAHHFTVNNAGDFLLSGGGSLLTTDLISLTATNNITLDGASNGKAFLLNAARDLTTNGTITTPGTFTATAKNAFINNSLQADAATFNVTTDFILAQSGSLRTTREATITSSNRDVILRGSTVADRLTINATRADAILDGSVQTNQLTVNAKKASIGGVLNSSGEIKFTLGQDMTLRSSGRLNTSSNIVITGQDVTLDGNATANDFRFTLTKNLLVDGILTGREFVISAGDAIFNNVLTSSRAIQLTLTGDFVTGAGGNLSAVNDLDVDTTGGALLSGTHSAANIDIVAAQDMTVNAGSVLNAGAASNSPATARSSPAA